LFGCSDQSFEPDNEIEINIAGLYSSAFIIDGGTTFNIYALIDNDNNARLMFFGLSRQAAGKLSNINNSYGGEFELVMLSSNSTYRFSAVLN